MTDLEKKEFKILYEYIKNDLLEYTDKPLPQWFILRLKGIHKGKFCANSKVESMGTYDYKTILITFKLKHSYLKSLIKRNKFKNEQHMINTIMLIVEKDINDVISMLKKRKVQKEVVNVQIDNMDKHIIKNTNVEKNKSEKLTDTQKMLW